MNGNAKKTNSGNESRVLPRDSSRRPMDWTNVVAVVGGKDGRGSESKTRNDGGEGGGD